MTLGLDLVIPYVSDITYQARILSDHSPLVLKFRISQPPIHKSWKVSSLWPQVLPLGDAIKGYLSEFFRNNKLSTSPLTVWDAMKAYLQGLLIKEIRLFKKYSRDWESFLSGEVCRKTNRKHICQPLSPNLYILGKMLERLLEKSRK